MVWDESQRLSAVQNNKGIHSYIYDYNGERLMKYSLIGSSVALNGQGPGATLQLTTPTVYVNGNYVTSHHGDWIDATRHYYMNSIRIASEVTGSVPTEAVLDPAANGDPTPFTLELDRVLNALDLSELEVEQFHWEAPSYRMTFSDADFDAAVQICNGEPACICDISQYHAPDHGAGCENALYWYHPDYLGNTEMVTDRWGGVYQFFHYSAFGEVLAQRHAYTGSFSSRYQFNAKEFDNETGFGYYGARYYQPEWSVWLSVDPEYYRDMNQTPYHFSYNNPLAFIDPNGKHGYRPGPDGTIEPIDPETHPEEAASGGDDFDVLYSSDLSSTAAVTYKSGTFNDSRIMNAKNRENGENIEIQMINFNDQEDAARVTFNFLRDYQSDTKGIQEYSLTQGQNENGESRSILTTTRNSNGIEFGARPALGTLVRDGFSNNLSTRHNHPNGTGPSGYDDGLIGDKTAHINTMNILRNQFDFTGHVDWFVDNKNSLFRYNSIAKYKLK